jgi:hypothetical protein
LELVSEHEKSSLLNQVSTDVESRPIDTPKAVMEAAEPVAAVETVAVIKSPELVAVIDAQIQQLAFTMLSDCSPQEKFS